MTFEASRFGAEERQLSDVESVQAPVQDNSKAMEISAFAQGVSSATQAGASIARMGQVTQQSAQEAAVLGQEKDFERELLKAKSLADKHGSQSIAFNTFLTNTFANSSLDFNSKTKMMKGFQATVLGKTFTELSPEEKAFKKVREDAVISGFVLETDTPEEIEEGLDEYRQFVTQARLDTEASAAISRKRAQVGLTTDERNLADKEMADKNYTAIANLAANHRTPTKNKVRQIVAAYTSGHIDRKAAEAQLQAAKGEVGAIVSQLSRNVPPAQVESLAKPLLGLYDVALANLDSTTLLREVENGNKLMIATTQRNQLTADPELVELASISSLSGNNNPAIAAKMSQKSLQFLKQNSDTKGDKVVDVTEVSEDMGTYLGSLTDGIDNLTRLDFGGQPLADLQELTTNVDNTLKGANHYINAEDKPSQNQKILEWLAQPRVGTFVKDNLNSLTPTARLSLTDTLINNATNYVYPKVQELVDSELKSEGQRFGVSEDDIEMDSSGGQVVFRAKTSDNWTRSVAAKMNREVGGALTTYFNAMGNVSGDGFSTTFERERANLWPSKYGEAVVDGVEDSQQYQEGKEYVDENGDVWLYNGTDFEARGSSDGG